MISNKDFQKKLKEFPDDLMVLPVVTSPKKEKFRWYPSLDMWQRNDCFGKYLLIESPELSKELWPKSCEKHIEDVSECIHDQWIEWSKAIFEDLHSASMLLSGIEADNLKELSDLIIDASEKASNINKRLVRWENLWIPYDELSEEMKEKDRGYAKRILEKLNYK